MNRKLEIQVEVDDKGRLVLPPAVVSQYKLKPGARVCFEDNGNGFRLHAGTFPLQKIYIEPTNRCNLECRTCMRQAWEEPLGQMTRPTFARILDGLQAFSPVPRVFFGGIGEPLAHPDTVDMVAQAKKLGAEVELITNGTLLSREMSRRLLNAGLDMLWVSVDGATPESYTDVRLGAALLEVLANIAAFGNLRQTEYTQRAQIGIAFVAMKRNIADLPEVLRIGKELGAKRFMVSNVLPYTAEMEKEILYARSRMDFFYGPYLELPVIDINETTLPPLYRSLSEGKSVAFKSTRPNEGKGQCPFIQSSTLALSWEGNLSPCLPLLHSHESFVEGRKRVSRRYAVGNLNERSLRELWDDPEYVSFRQRVEDFHFSPCAICGGCEWGEGNEEDCFGNTFPTCGGCLWAQGVIQCP
jgi:MoaA/NifB/PqqE/SkfB family radical SAM enzyme